MELKNQLNKLTGNNIGTRKLQILRIINWEDKTESKTKIGGDCCSRKDNLENTLIFARKFWVVDDPWSNRSNKQALWPFSFQHRKVIKSHCIPYCFSKGWNGNYLNVLKQNQLNVNLTKSATKLTDYITKLNFDVFIKIMSNFSQIMSWRHNPDWFHSTMQTKPLRPNESLSDNYFYE